MHTHTLTYPYIILDMCVCVYSYIHMYTGGLKHTYTYISKDRQRSVCVCVYLKPSSDLCDEGCVLLSGSTPWLTLWKALAGGAGADRVRCLRTCMQSAGCGCPAPECGGGAGNSCKEEHLAVGGKSQHPDEETLFGKAAAETFMRFQKLGQQGKLFTSI